jgi:DNA-binding response OmpR family regulator
VKNTSEETPVLVVDDDFARRAAVERLLRGEGYDAQSAGTVQEAIRKVERFRPRIILLDQVLNDGDGLEVLQYVRVRRMNVAVALTVGAVEREVQTVYRSAGADAVFTKPYNATEILNWLREKSVPKGADGNEGHGR